MTILHHANKIGYNERMSAQDGFAWRQYMQKNFTHVQRWAGFGVLTLRFGLRATLGGKDKQLNRDRRMAARAAMGALHGLRQPPFGSPPPHALIERSSGKDGRSLPGRLGGSHSSPCRSG